MRCCTVFLSNIYLSHFPTFYTISEKGHNDMGNRRGYSRLNVNASTGNSEDFKLLNHPFSPVGQCIHYYKDFKQGTSGSL